MNKRLVAAVGVAGAGIAVYGAVLASAVFAGVVALLLVVVAGLGVFRIYRAIRAQIIREDADLMKYQRESRITVFNAAGNTYFTDGGNQAWANLRINPASHFTDAGPLSNDPEENRRWAFALANGQNSGFTGVSGQNYPGGHGEGPRVRPSDPCRGNGPGPVSSVLDRLKAAERVLILGGSGTGKTSLVQHLAVSGVETIIIDPHSGPRTWPVSPSVRVVGRGRDYEAIRAELDRIVNVMDDRYKDIAEGIDDDFDPIRLVIDEFSSLNQVMDISKPVKTLLCEARKARIGIIISGHSDRVGPLGLKGAGDLVECFEAVARLSRGFKIELDGERFDHPGPCRMIEYGPGHDTRHRNDTDRFPPDTPADTEGTRATRATPVDPMGRKIVSMFDAKESMSAICRAVFGSKGGRQLREIKAVLEREGRI